MPDIGIKPKHGVYFDKNRNITRMYELNLELRNKSKTQARQSKNYSKNYHNLLVISRAHGKNITLRNY